MFSDGSPARGRLGQQEAEPSRSYPALTRPLLGGERVPPLGAEQEDGDTTHERYGTVFYLVFTYIESESTLIYLLNSVYQEDMIVLSNVKRKKNEESCILSKGQWREMIF